MVTFVGAGPGAKDLITVRGQRLLEEADIVIYAGSLVNPKLLYGCKETCAVYNSAKMTLEEVLEVILKERTLSGFIQAILACTGRSKSRWMSWKDLGSDTKCAPASALFARQQLRSMQNIHFREFHSRL